MHISTITLFPKMFDALQSGIVGRAQKNNLLKLSFDNPRDFTTDPHRTVDDRPYGGGPGMVMRYEPLAAAIDHAKQTHPHNTPVIYLSPQGKPLTHDLVNTLSQETDLILLAGRYEGVDERLIEDKVDVEVSIGDYVLSGGELPAMVLIDAITRLLPGALGHENSATEDSFFNGLLDHPHYTRPEMTAEKTVPEVLLSGDHQAIEAYRLKQSLGRTWQRRPDLLKRRVFTPKEQKLLEDYQREASKNADKTKD